MKDAYGPSVDAPVQRRTPYDVHAEAERIAGIDDWVERRQAMERVPRMYQNTVTAMVGMLFKARIRGS